MATATIHGATHAPFHLPQRLANAADAVANQISVWRRRSRARAELVRWEDRDLRDAGISRAALEAELAKPFWRD